MLSKNINAKLPAIGFSGVPLIFCAVLHSYSSPISAVLLLLIEAIKLQPGVESQEITNKKRN